MRGIGKKTGDARDGQADWRMHRILLAQRFPGWTLEYIDALSWEDLCDIQYVIPARNKAEADEARARRR